MERGEGFLMFFNAKGKCSKWRPTNTIRALFRCTERDQMEYRKLKKTRRTCTKERTKQRESLDKEIASLDRLYRRT